jgi:single-strand DNA-binding protein
MPNLNKVMLIGNLTRDPELRYTPNNTAICGFGLAINRKWNGQDGQQNEETTFVDCEAWARAGEVINQYVRKGRPLFVEGRLKLDQWQDKDGGKRSKLKVVVENFQFLDSNNEGGSPRSTAPQQGVNRPGGNGSDEFPF